MEGPQEGATAGYCRHEQERLHDSRRGKGPDSSWTRGAAVGSVQLSPDEALLAVPLTEPDNGEQNRDRTQHPPRLLQSSGMHSILVLDHNIEQDKECR